MYDIIIVGAGPAGMTAAVYARRAGKSVLVLEASGYGGQIIKAAEIRNYPTEKNISGVEFATKLYEQAEALGAEFRFEKVIGIEDKGSEKLVTTVADTYTAGAVIVATGSDSRKLGLADEDKLVGRGVSYCATCDGSFFRGKNVAVAGGGSTAVDDALYLSQLAEKVYLIYRTPKLSEEGAKEKLSEHENIVLMPECSITSLNADKKLESITVKHKDGTEEDLDVSGLFVAVGRVPENQNFAKLIDLNEKGYAVSGENCHTATPGIFVAGDNRVKELRQLVTAAADGAVAATEAVKYLRTL